jgi:hypothetical protein
MVLFGVQTIRLILILIPLMIVVVLFVVVLARCRVIVGEQRCRRNRYGDGKGGTEQSCIQETGHSFSPGLRQSNRRAKRPLGVLAGATIGKQRSSYPQLLFIWRTSSVLGVQKLHMEVRDLPSRGFRLRLRKESPPSPTDGLPRQ